MDMTKYTHPISFFAPLQFRRWAVAAILCTAPLLNAGETQEPNTDDFQRIHVFLQPYTAQKPSKTGTSYTEIEMDEITPQQKPLKEKTLAEILAENERLREEFSQLKQPSFSVQSSLLTQQQAEVFLASLDIPHTDNTGTPPHDPTLQDILSENQRMREQINVLTQILLRNFHEDYGQKKVLYEHLACSQEQIQFMLSQIREELSKVYGISQETASGLRKKPDPNFIRRNFQWFKTGTAIGIGTFTGYETYGTAVWMTNMLPVYMAPHPFTPLAIGVTVGLTSYLMTIVCGKAL